MMNIFKLFLLFTFLVSAPEVFCHETPITINKASSPSITHKIEKKIRPYLLPKNHPMKERLDALFHSSRATQDENTFANAGFSVFSVRPRSYVVVARHPDLPKYVVKVNLDNNIQLKRNKESWEWFKMRCEGAERICKVIKQKKIKHFVVARKWLYPLPEDPAPPNDPNYTRHLVILLARDMNLVSRKENLFAWKNSITSDHLDELFEIVSHARGSSYRPDNIHLTVDGTFAFIDTEYPHSKPDYISIRPYLNDEMCAYWDKLVKHGGNK